MRACLSILIFLFLADTVGMAQPPTQAAQVPAPEPTRAARAGTGVIRGRVVRADTGQPLRRVQVHVDEWSTADRSGPAATMTDTDGRYELTQLPAGRYQLKATRGGYVEVAYGQRRPFERGRPLELGDGAVLQNIDFALPPGAVVAGRVVDELGEAIAHVQVSLERRRFIEGARRWVAESSGSSDDRGDFRIFGAAPGDYVVVARLMATELGARDRVRYVPTYYPGTPIASEAQRLTLGPGQEVPGITIALARAATATVRGVVRSAGASFGPFMMVSARETNASQAYSQPAMALAAGDGSFAITGLLPGTYTVEARSPTGLEFASAEVVVEGADVAGITLSLSKGATARGRIRFDSEDTPKDLRPSQVFVRPTFVDSSMEQQMVSSGLPVTRDDWTFELQGLRGRGFVRAGTLSDWQMKRVQREGVDVTDTPLEFASDIDGLEIELTRRLTTVSGGVSDDHDAVALDATVVVFADDPAKWGASSRFIGSARPDQEGRFTIHGLPPGRYLAIAVGYLQPGEEQDPDVLEGWRKGATPLTLSEGEARILDLKLSAS